MKAPRFSAGEYEDFYDNNLGEEVRVWSCCGREEHEKPRKDWWNVTFSRGQPKPSVFMRSLVLPDCPPTYHEPVEKAAGWDGWKRIDDDGNVVAYDWKVRM